MGAVIILAVNVIAAALMLFLAFVLWDEWRVMAMTCLAVGALLAISIIAQSLPLPAPPEYVPQRQAP